MTRIALRAIETALIGIGWVLWLPVLAVLLIGSGALIVAAIAHDYIYLPVHEAARKGKA